LCCDFFNSIVPESQLNSGVDATVELFSTLSATEHGLERRGKAGIEITN